MDRYVHVTGESLAAGVKQFEQGQRVNNLSTPEGEDERAGKDGDAA